MYGEASAPSIFAALTSCSSACVNHPWKPWNCCALTCSGTLPLRICHAYWTAHAPHMVRASASADFSWIHASTHPRSVDWRAMESIRYSRRIWSVFEWNAASTVRQSLPAAAARSFATSASPRFRSMKVFGLPPNKCNFDSASRPIVPRSPTELGRPGQLLPHQRHHPGSIKLDAPHHLFVRQGAVAVLHVEPRQAERAYERGDLRGYGIGRSDEESSVGTRGGVELLSRHGRPASLATDLGHDLRVVRPELLARLLVRVG